MTLETLAFTPDRVLSFVQDEYLAFRSAMTLSYAALSKKSNVPTSIVPICTLGQKW